MNEVLIIIIIYKKSINDLCLVTEILESEEKEIDILIYDNSPKQQDFIGNEKPNIHYVHDGENPGVSRGYNIGIDKARELKKNYVLLLDQDTELTLRKLEKYIILKSIYNNNYIYAPLVVKRNKVYSPFLEKYTTGRTQKKESFKYTEKYSIYNNSLINSGLMIPLKIINEIGGFNEKIKLDFSDYYFIEKYKKLKYEIILVDVMLTHSFSGDEGKNYDKEMHRFKYYCNGARELSRSLSKSTFISVTKRMARLIQKYHTLRPIVIYVEYYFLEFKI